MLNRITAAEIVNYGVTCRGILVDGRRLDALLEDACPGHELAGLVPTWLDWYDDGPVGRAEEAYVRDRTVLGTEPVTLPILLCPDDFEFLCTTVVVEVVAAGDVVHWRRFGLDRTPFHVDAPMPRYIGEVVDWLPDAPEFRFARPEYLACLARFPVPQASR